MALCLQMCDALWMYEKSYVFHHRQIILHYDTCFVMIVWSAQLQTNASCSYTATRRSGTYERLVRHGRGVCISLFWFNILYICIHVTDSVLLPYDLVADCRKHETQHNAQQSTEVERLKDGEHFIERYRAFLINCSNHSSPLIMNPVTSKLDPY